MPYLIDGHNLIGKMPGLNLDDLDDEQRLIEILQEFCTQNSKEVEVFFDQSSTGQGKARVHGRVTARYIGAHETADQAIARRLKNLNREAANWSVVSSDREVQAAAKRARARIVPSNEFSGQLSKPASKTEDFTDEKLSKDEVDEWMELFGEKKEKGNSKKK